MKIKLTKMESHLVTREVLNQYVSQVSFMVQIFFSIRKKINTWPKINCYFSPVIARSRGPTNHRSLSSAKMATFRAAGVR